MNSQTEYILKHCFVGDAKDYAKRNLKGKLIDTTAANDIKLASEMSDNYCNISQIESDSFERMYRYENIQHDLISDFILSEIPDREWKTKMEPYQEGGYHTGRVFYLGDERVDMGYPEYGGSELFRHVADEMCYYYGYEKGKKKMKEIGIKPKSFGRSKADYINGTMFAIQEYFDEIKSEIEGITTNSE